MHYTKSGNDNNVIKNNLFVRKNIQTIKFNDIKDCTEIWCLHKLYEIVRTI